MHRHFTALPAENRVLMGEKQFMSEYRYRVAEAITAAREAAGISQRELADRLGRDKRTIQKWEKGEMKIALEDFLAIFDALKIQVEAYSKWIRHPELFPKGLADIRGFSTDKKRSALADYYTRQASPLEVQQEYYFLFANHGSSCDGMYQQWMANLMTPLRDRKRICGQIIDNYNEALATGTLTDPEAPQPNMDVLLACYKASFASIQNGDDRYALVALDSEE